MCWKQNAQKTIPKENNEQQRFQSVPNGPSEWHMIKSGADREKCYGLFANNADSYHADREGRE